MTNSNTNTEDTSPYESFDSRKLHEAAERASITTSANLTSLRPHALKACSA